MARLIRKGNEATLAACVLQMRGKNEPLANLLADCDVPFSDGSTLGGVKLLKNFKPDIFYGFGVYRVIWAPIARKCGVTTCVGAERNSWPRKVDPLIRRIDRMLLDGYISNTQLIADKLVKGLGIDRNRCYVALNGIELPDEVVSAEKCSNWGHPTIVCVANIQPRKGQIYLLRAIARLRSRYPRLKALLIGKDYTNGDFARIAESEGLDDLYVATGYQRDVLSVVQASDLFVLPAISTEGMPTAILEAMAVGTPVIATDIGGTRELVLNNQTGLLLPARSAEALEAAIDRLLSDTMLAQNLASNAIDRVKSIHCVQSMLSSHMIAFKALQRVAAG